MSNDWIKYDGEVAPTFDDGTMVEVETRDGEVWIGSDALEGSHWDWGWIEDDSDNDIVAYRIKGE
jgi:hypothetical protein